MSVWEDDLELILVDETKGLDYCNSNMVGDQDESTLRAYTLDILGSMKHDDPIERIVQIFSLDIHKWDHVSGDSVCFQAEFLEYKKNIYGIVGQLLFF